MGTAKAASESILIKSAVNASIGLLNANFFDGTRRPIPQQLDVLLTIHDGAQTQLFRNVIRGSTVQLQLPFHNNFTDNYSILASADGYQQAGFQPVRIGPNAPVQLDLMLLPQKAEYHFAGACWSDIWSLKPLVGRIFAASAERTPGDVYSELMEQHPERLACLLNLTTAMQQITLPQGSPLSYFKTFDLAALSPDRICGFADANLVEQVKLAAQRGEFDTEPLIDLSLHKDATSSFKQKQFGEANVQLTFHQKNQRVIDGVSCIYVEADIDYYKDPAAHLLLEVIPNGLTGRVSNPRVVYVLRWIAGRHAKITNFDPLYTIE